MPILEMAWEVELVQVSCWLKAELVKYWELSLLQERQLKGELERRQPKIFICESG